MDPLLVVSIQKHIPAVVIKLFNQLFDAGDAPCNDNFARQQLQRTQFAVRHVVAPDDVIDARRRVSIIDVNANA